MAVKLDVIRAEQQSDFHLYFHQFSGFKLKRIGVAHKFGVLSQICIPG